jgi:hypothetical protein
MREDGLKAWEGTKKNFKSVWIIIFNSILHLFRKFKKRVERVRLRAELVRMYFSLILSLSMAWF